MLLSVHVVIALMSIAYTTYLFAAPTKEKFYIAYGLIGLTLLSGTILVVSTHAHLLSACETGLLYLGIVFSGLAAARYRLARSEVRVRSDDRRR